MLSLLKIRAGQSLLEVLIATAVGAILIIGAATIISPALKENTDATKIQGATATAKQLVENVRSWAESDWHNISNLTVGTSQRYYFTTGISTSTGFTLATGTESVVAAPTANLLAYWRFDEQTTSSSLDHGGYGFHGIIYNDVSRTSTLATGGLYFGGTTAQFIASSTASLKYQGGDMSISFWFKPDSTDDGGYIVAKPWNATPVQNYYISSSGGANPILTFYLNGATSYTLQVGRSIPSGLWHHAVVTVHGATKVIRWYLDGQEINSGTHVIASWTPTGGDSNISFVAGCVYPYAAANCGATTNDYKGYLDELRIYSRVLSANEILGVYGAVPYWRYFNLESIYRSTTGTITSGGTLDPSSLDLTVYAGWSGSASTSISTVITRTPNRRFVQTDWTGGSGQVGPVTSTNSRYFSSDVTINTTSTYGTSSGFIYLDGLSY